MPRDEDMFGGSSPFSPAGRRTERGAGYWPFCFSGNYKQPPFKSTNVTSVHTDFEVKIEAIKKKLSIIKKRSSTCCSLNWHAPCYRASG